MYRKDVKSDSGGILAYARSDLVQQRRTDLETSDCRSVRIEIIVIEVKLYKEKWFICNIYKQPKVKNEHIVEVLESVLDRTIGDSANVILVGDLNVDVSNPSHGLKHVFHVQGVKNIVKEPTCYKNHQNLSIIDLVITNVPSKLQNVICTETGLSDFHSMICFASKVKLERCKMKTITYRCYKQFDCQQYSNDLSMIPFHVKDIFDDLDDKYWCYESLIKEVINSHAPLKTKHIKHNMVPYMNSTLV